jgi:hypothetical protein
VHAARGPSGVGVFLFIEVHERHFRDRLKLRPLDLAARSAVNALCQTGQFLRELPRPARGDASGGVKADMQFNGFPALGAIERLRLFDYSIA